MRGGPVVPGNHSGILKGSLQGVFGDNLAAYLNKCGRKVVSGGK